MLLMMLRSLVFALSGALVACSGEAPPAAGGAAASCQTRAYGDIGGPVSLIDATGQRVTEADFKGAPSLVYFGFTYCPDVCPSSLVKIERALRRLPEGVTPPRTILISVDPERDTPEALAAYISTPVFPNDIVGLTGTEEEVRAAAEGFKTSYSRIEEPDSLSEYTMDHFSIIYLMDEDWSLKTFFSSDVTIEGLADCLESHLS